MKRARGALRYFMRITELKAWIESLEQDIDFVYMGVSGTICPFTQNEISVSYDNEERLFSSVDDALTTPFIRGQAIKDICEAMEF